MNVEVNNLSTISNVLVSIIQHVSLDNSGECGHLIVKVTRVPGDTTDEAFARGSDGIIVNLGCFGEQSHACLVWYVNSITPQEGVLRGRVTLIKVVASEVC